MAALAGCANDPVPTAVRAAIPQGWSRFTSDDRRYSYSHPGEWTFQASPGQTALFSVTDGAAFATVLLDAPLGPDKQAATQDMLTRLVAQSARNNEQLLLLGQQPWAQLSFEHVALETQTVDPVAQIKTQHVTFLIAAPLRRTLFAQYYHVGIAAFTAAERELVRAVLATLDFQP
jgi:hypothetical protein